MDRKTALIKTAFAVVIIIVLMAIGEIKPLFGGIIIALIIIVGAVRTRGFKGKREE